MEKKLTTKKTSAPLVNLLLVRWLQRCAETFPMYGKTLADYPGRFELFREATANLSDLQLDFAFKQAAAELTEFPLPAQIRQYAEAMPAPPEVQERVEGGYRNMVEAYKQKHREEMSNRPVSVLEMPADPKAALDSAIERVAAVKAMDAPGNSLHDYQRAVALERLGGSTQPEDPEKRKVWAHDMAVKNGWIKPREAGEEG